MKSLIAGFLVVAAAATIVANVSANITTCSALGGVSGFNAAYGTCITTQNGGTGSVIWSKDGLNAVLAAKTGRRAEQVAATWHSASAVIAPTEICILVNVSRLALAGSGRVGATLKISYTGGTTTAPDNWDYVGLHALCEPTPAGATNLWWQVVVTAGGEKYSGSASATISLADVQLM